MLIGLQLTNNLSQVKFPNSKLSGRTSRIRLLSSFSFTVSMQAVIMWSLDVTALKESLLCHQTWLKIQITRSLHVQKISFSAIWMITASTILPPSKAYHYFQCLLTMKEVEPSQSQMTLCLCLSAMTSYSQQALHLTQKRYKSIAILNLKKKLKAILSHCRSLRYGLVIHLKTQSSKLLQELKVSRFQLLNN